MYRPAWRPPAVSIASSIAETEPLPFVPPTRTDGNARSGWSRRCKERADAVESQLDAVGLQTVQPSDGIVGHGITRKTQGYHSAPRTRTITENLEALVEENGKLALLATIAGALLLLFLRLGSYPLLDPDESRFARTSVEMMRSGDYVVPTFEGEPRLVKPPMLHWIQTALFQLGEPSEMLARLPAAASTFVSLLLVAWIGWRRFGVEGSAWAAVFFLTGPLVVVIGRVGTLDALLSVHVLAVLALERVQHEQTGLERYGVMGLLLGLALLVKGPVGVVLPLLMILAGRTATGRDVLPSLEDGRHDGAGHGRRGASVGAGVHRADRREAHVPAPTCGNRRRAVTGTDHIAPWWYYLAVCGVAFLPWAGPLFLGTIRGIVHWRDRDSPTGPFAAAAFAAGIVFFSLSKGKLPTYILPLAPLASLVITFELGQELVNPKKRRAGSVLVALTLVALAVGLGITAALTPEPMVQGTATFARGRIRTRDARCARRMS